MLPLNVPLLVGAEAALVITLQPPIVRNLNNPATLEEGQEGYEDARRGHEAANSITKASYSWNGQHLHEQRPHWEGHLSYPS